ncbi:hypothetical protein cbdbA1409 [Dehalococcoides mccartyi CBDB1]|uniref:Uncharacterized protein n=1 Tax=Dehalococcoides mccartyi (strain CBDB1) TaxID=255470 RepID=A0A916KN39_DEHMC|nr:hypothetical protein cbdbA1409 [Dehalococcoides mccartyi CBDB1]
MAITSTYGGCFPASSTETQPDRLVMSDNHSQPANHDPAGIQTSRQSRHDGQRTLGKVKSELGMTQPQPRQRQAFWAPMFRSPFRRISPVWLRYTAR